CPFRVDFAIALISADLSAMNELPVRKGGGPYQPRPCLAIAAWKAFTAAAGPSGCFQIPAETARKSAPASISGTQFSTVMPPMATQGISISSDHQAMISGSARVVGCLVSVGKKAPNAT